MVARLGGLLRAVRVLALPVLFAACGSSMREDGASDGSAGAAANGAGGGASGAGGAGSGGTGIPGTGGVYGPECFSSSACCNGFYTDPNSIEAYVVRAPACPTGICEMNEGDGSLLPRCTYRCVPGVTDCGPGNECREYPVLGETGGPPSLAVCAFFLL